MFVKKIFILLIISSSLLFSQNITEIDSVRIGPSAYYDLEFNQDYIYLLHERGLSTFKDKTPPYEMTSNIHMDVGETEKLVANDTHLILFGDDSLSLFDLCSPDAPQFINKITKPFPFSDIKKFDSLFVAIGNQNYQVIEIIDGQIKLNVILPFYSNEQLAFNYPFIVKRLNGDSLEIFKLNPDNSLTSIHTKAAEGNLSPVAYNNKLFYYCHIPGSAWNYPPEFLGYKSFELSPPNFSSSFELDIWQGYYYGTITDLSNNFVLVKYYSVNQIAINFSNPYAVYLINEDSNYKLFISNNDIYKIGNNVTSFKNFSTEGILFPNIKLSESGDIFFLYNNRIEVSRFVNNQFNIIGEVELSYDSLFTTFNDGFFVCKDDTLKKYSITNSQIVFEYAFPNEIITFAKQIDDLLIINKGYSVLEFFKIGNSTITKLLSLPYFGRVSEVEKSGSSIFITSPQHGLVKYEYDVGINHIWTFAAKNKYQALYLSGDKLLYCCRHTAYLIDHTENTQNIIDNIYIRYGIEAVKFIEVNNEPVYVVKNSQNDFEFIRFGWDENSMSIVRSDTLINNNYQQIINSDNKILLLNDQTIYSFNNNLLTAVNCNKLPLPKEFYLSQNYPNPFNPETVISFNLSKKGLTTLKVYDILGNEIVSLIDKELQAGAHKIKFNAANLASGVYLYRLTAANFTDTKTMMLIK